MRIRSYLRLGLLPRCAFFCPHHGAALWEDGDISGSVSSRIGAWCLAVLPSRLYWPLLFHLRCESPLIRTEIQHPAKHAMLLTFELALELNQPFRGCRLNVCITPESSVRIIVKSILYFSRSMLGHWMSIGCTEYNTPQHDLAFLITYVASIDLLANFWSCFSLSTRVCGADNCRGGKNIQAILPLKAMISIIF